jgi:hypothetical protein
MNHFFTAGRCLNTLSRADWALAASGKCGSLVSAATLVPEDDGTRRGQAGLTGRLRPSREATAPARSRQHDIGGASARGLRVKITQT